MSLHSRRNGKVPRRAAGSDGSVRIRVAEEHHAVTLRNELADIAGVDVSRRSDCWDISLDSVITDRLVGQVLDAVRRTLEGDPSSSAHVRLNGHDYYMQDEPIPDQSQRTDRQGPDPARASAL